MKPQFRVIAMANSKRLPHFIAQEQTSDFEVFTACNGNAGDADQYFDSARFSSEFGVEATPGEKGCAASHYLVMKEFIAEAEHPNDLLVVAEDDAIVSKNFRAVIERLSQQDHDFDFLVLADPFGEADRFHCGGKSEYFTQVSLLAKRLGKFGDTAYRYGSYSGDLGGTGLYAVTAKGARRYCELVEREGGIHWMADEYSYWAPKADVKVKRLVPNLAGWLGDSVLHDLSHLSPAYNVQAGIIGAIKGKIAIRSRARYYLGALRAAVGDLRGSR